MCYGRLVCWDPSSQGYASEVSHLAAHEDEPEEFPDYYNVRIEKLAVYGPRSESSQAPTFFGLDGRLPASRIIKQNKNKNRFTNYSIYIHLQ